MTEWKLEDALVVEREEGRMEGREERGFEVAKNALAKGLSLDIISKITGLNIDTSALIGLKIPIYAITQRERKLTTKARRTVGS
jgi:hypothetical protein